MESHSFPRYIYRYTGCAGRPHGRRAGRPDASLDSRQR